MVIMGCKTGKWIAKTKDIRGPIDVGSYTYESQAKYANKYANLILGNKISDKKIDVCPEEINIIKTRVVANLVDKCRSITMGDITDRVRALQ